MISYKLRIFSGWSQREVAEVEVRDLSSLSRSWWAIVGHKAQGLWARTSERSLRTEGLTASMEMRPCPRNWILPAIWWSLKVAFPPEPPEGNSLLEALSSVLGDPDRKIQVTLDSLTHRNWEIINGCCSKPLRSVWLFGTAAVEN